MRYFHESLNHASEELMIRVVEHKLIEDLPDVLTTKLIHKHFPVCDACPHSNLARRPIFSNPIDRQIEVGEEWELDIKGAITDNKGKVCPTFSGNKYWLICRCIRSRMRFGFLLPNHGYLLRYIKQLVLLCKHKHRTIKTILIDDEFYTDEINEYFLNNHITRRACIPHEHATLPNIERDNRTVMEAIIKALQTKSHLEFKYWGMAFHDVLSKMNIFSTTDNPSESPFFLWYGFKYNLIDNPCIPFGSVVMAHLPLKDQTALSGRCIRTYYIGIAPDHKGGILLYNPKTKRTIVRRTFKIMGPTDQSTSKIKIEASLDDDQEEDIDYKHPYGADLYLDHDPIDHEYTRHIPQVNNQILDEDEFYVEKIINHKGKGNKMKFFVKWLHYDDEHNSWISWNDTKDLAALDTYLLNNPDINVPVSNVGLSCSKFKVEDVPTLVGNEDNDNVDSKDEILIEINNILHD